MVHPSKRREAKAPSLGHPSSEAKAGKSRRAKPYATSLDHVLAELDRVRILILPRAEDASEQRAAFEEAGREIEARMRASLRAGRHLRLPALAWSFGLTQFDVDALLLSLLPEAGVEIASADLSGNGRHQQWPTVDLIRRLLAPSMDDRILVRSRFLPDAPLVRHGLVKVFTDAPELSPALLSRLVRVDPRVASHLFGSDAIDPELRPHVALVAPREGPQHLSLPADVEARLRRFVRPRRDDVPPSAIVYLQGPPGSGKRSTAESLSRYLGVGLLVVDGGALGALSDDDLRAVVRRCVREARLLGAAICWEDADPLLDEERPHVRAAVLGAIEEHLGVTFLAGKKPWEPGGALAQRDFVRVEMPRPSAAEQARLWDAALADAPGRAADVDLEALTGSFRMSGGQIRDAAATAVNLARFRSPGDAVAHADLTAAARLHASRNLTSMGRKLSPRAVWEDLVLPPEQEERLQEMRAHLRHRGRVMDTWGFDGKLSLGKGMSALFSGPPGTGKTMAAGVLAGELGLDLYHVDLSAVVSKYIGETEKHLSRLFDEAESASAILFFDEADALFGKRTEVRDAHDRNANIEASYLLQRLESYDGVAILASNLTKNMDEAFVRRIRLIVEFPFPAEAERRRIWERLFPAAAPLSSDVDFDLLARQIELAGGHLRNIALRAAFLAAEEGADIGMGQLLRAARWEYQKMGKVVDLSRFARPAAGR